jgi:DNA invertase Pin-like site-specific DNA recombinase
MLIGYIRALPDLAAAPQRTALNRSACQKLYEEPGQPLRRFAERDRMLDHLWEGDTVLVARLDCLADTLLELVEIGQRLFDREAGLISRAEPWADTTLPAGAGLLAMLNGLASFAQRSGVDPRIDAAPPPRQPSKAGRPPKITLRQWEQYGSQLISGELDVPTAAKLMGCGRATLYRHLALVR